MKSLRFLYKNRIISYIKISLILLTPTGKFHFRKDLRIRFSTGLKILLKYLLSDEQPIRSENLLLHTLISPN